MSDLFDLDFLKDPLDLSGARGQERAIEEQSAQNLAERELQARLAAEARADVLALLPAAEANILTGLQGGLDVLGQTIPQQFEAFQGGNVAAQEALLSGLPQIQNALLGRPVDLSGLQARAIPIDTSFAQQQLPQFQSSTEALITAGRIPVPGGSALVPSNISSIQTNEDLFRAASQGIIPNLTDEEQDFFRRHLSAVSGTPEAQGTGFVTDPLGGIEREVGAAGGFAPAGERKLANLLTQFNTLRNP